MKHLFYSLLTTCSIFCSYPPDCWLQKSTPIIFLNQSVSASCKSYAATNTTAMITRMRSYMHHDNSRSWVPTIDSNTLYSTKSYTKQYTLSKKATNYCNTHNIDTNLCETSFEGTDAQHSLYDSFMQFFKKAASCIAKRAPPHQLYHCVIDHAVAGCLATRANNLDLARSLNTFCSAVFECAELVTNAIITGASNTVYPALHPIQATQNLFQAVCLVSECAAVIIERAFQLTSVRSQQQFQQWKKQQLDDLEPIYLLLKEELKQITPKNAAQKIVSYTIETAVSANLFKAIIPFLRTIQHAKSRINSLIKKSQKSTHFIVASTAEGIPISIGNKITQFFKAESTATSRFQCACPTTRKAHIHPHGIYQDAPYHKAIGNSLKSARPLDGQLALDHSIPLSDNSIRRIGVSRGQIVMLGRTQEGLYHGHVTTWKELRSEIRNSLEKLNFVTSKGKIKRKDLL